MGILSKIFNGGAEKLIGTIGGIVDDLSLSKEEKETLKIKLIEAQNSHEVKLAELAEKELEAQLKDTANARDSNVAIQNSDKASWLSKNVAYMLDLFVGAVWGGITLYLTGRALKLVADSVDLTAVLSIYSTVTAVFMIIIGFHRGSSRSSDNKDKTIQTMMSK